jgi:hypothetical protein
VKKTGTKRGGSKPVYKKRFFLPVMFLCLLPVVGVALILTRNLNPPAGKINGEPFYAEELAMYADELRAAVAWEYSQKYHLDAVGARFWETRYDGVTPHETLNNRALAALVRNKVIMREARKHGITLSEDYRELMKELEDRNKKAAAGDIFYGPKSLDPMEYSSYRITEITDSLKFSLLQGELAPTETDLRRVFAELPEELKEKDYAASGFCFKWNEQEEPISLVKELQEAIQQGRSPEDTAAFLASGFPSLSWEEFSLNSGVISKEDRHQQNLIRLLYPANIGDYILSPTRNALYYITTKEGGGLFRYEEAPGLARNKWINDQFEIFVNKKIAAASITIYK